MSKRRQTPKPFTSDATPNPQVLTDYPTHIPPLDAPPQSAFWRCHCGAVLIERIWHNRTAAVPAHWEICDPPRSPIRDVAHTADVCQRHMDAREETYS
jgi:hypothetical protein